MFKFGKDVMNGVKITSLTLHGHLKGCFPPVVSKLLPTLHNFDTYSRRIYISFRYAHPTSTHLQLNFFLVRKEQQHQFTF
jgi:hypothetical protein